MDDQETMIIKPIRLGLIGCGIRLRSVLRLLMQCAPAGVLQVRSVFDPDERALQELSLVLGQEFLAGDRPAAVWESPDVDWVLIGSWNALHAQQSICALRAGKDVFCEKPLATTFEDGLAIRDAVAESGRTFALGLVLRYSRHYQKIREILDSGRLGKLISMEFNETLAFNHGGHIYGNWRKESRVSGGHMLEKCCHDLDLANWFANSLPMHVASFGGKDFFVPENAERMDEIGPNAEGVPAYKSWSKTCNDPDHPFLSGGDVLDNQVVILEYANGVRASFHANSNAGIPERRFYILGSHGSLRADLLSGSIEVCEIGWETRIETIALGETDGHGGGDEIMAQALYRTMREQESPLASVREGLCSMIVALGIDQACREKRVINLHSQWLDAGVLKAEDKPKP